MLHSWLVESMDAELPTWRANCEALHGFLTAGESAPTNPCVVQGSVVLHVALFIYKEEKRTTEWETVYTTVQIQCKIAYWLYFKSFMTSLNPNILSIRMSSQGWHINSLK